MQEYIEPSLCFSSYDSSGMRISKVGPRVGAYGNSFQIDYHYDGDALVYERRFNPWPDAAGTTVMTIRYIYDANGIQGFYVKTGTATTRYYYVKNMLGDIIGITDDDGVLVAQYTYNAYGKIMSILDGNGNDVSTNYTHIANINPFRYKGYYYDIETGFYYLQSRYYDPEIGRFINADGYVSTGQGVLGNNMFAYCGNNPVNYYDPFGMSCICLTQRVHSRHKCTPTIREDLKSAPDLDIKTAPHNEYNCYGNAIEKLIIAVPSGYTQGDSVEKTFEAVKNDLGSDNVRELTSINDSIGPDEYMVAMKCTYDDFHFIRLTDDGWYNKSGYRHKGVYVDQNAVTAEVWLTRFETIDGMNYIGAPYYTSRTIYFAVKVGWDEQ